MVRFLAALMAAANASAWVVVSRWESRGKRAKQRFKLRPPRLIEWGFNRTYAARTGRFLPRLGRHRG